MAQFENQSLPSIRLIQAAGAAKDFQFTQRVFSTSSKKFVSNKNSRQNVVPI